MKQLIRIFTFVFATAMAAAPAVSLAVVSPPQAQPVRGNYSTSITPSFR